MLRPVEDYAGDPRGGIPPVGAEPGADHAIWLPDDRFAVVVHGSSTCPSRVKALKTYDGYLETTLTLETLGKQPCSRESAPHTTVFEAPPSFLETNSDVMIGLPGGKVALSHDSGH